MQSAIVVGCKHVGNTIRACKTKRGAEGLQLVGLQGPTKIELSVLKCGANYCNNDIDKLFIG